MFRAVHAGAWQAPFRRPAGPAPSDAAVRHRPAMWTCRLSVSLCTALTRWLSPNPWPSQTCCSIALSISVEGCFSRRTETKGEKFRRRSSAYAALNRLDLDQNISEHRTMAMSDRDGMKSLVVVLQGGDVSGQFCNTASSKPAHCNMLDDHDNVLDRAAKFFKRARPSS